MKVIEVVDESSLDNCRKSSIGFWVSIDPDLKGLIAERVSDRVEVEEMGSLDPFLDFLLRLRDILDLDKNL